MVREEYSSVSLQASFLKTIDDFLEELKKHGIDLGYTSRADVIKDGVRELMMKIRTTILLGVSDGEQ